MAGMKVLYLRPFVILLFVCCAVIILDGRVAGQLARYLVERSLLVGSLVVLLDCYSSWWLTSYLVGWVFSRFVGQLFGYMVIQRVRWLFIGWMVIQQVRWLFIGWMISQMVGWLFSWWNWQLAGWIRPGRRLKIRWDESSPMRHCLCLQQFCTQANKRSNQLRQRNVPWENLCLTFISTFTQVQV